MTYSKRDDLLLFMGLLVAVQSTERLGMTPLQQNKELRNRLGIGLLLLATLVGIIWLFTGIKELEPVGFILGTLAGVFLAS